MAQAIKKGNMTTIETGGTCPITGQEMTEVFREIWDMGYAIEIDGERYAFLVCKGCQSKILDDQVKSEFNAYFRKNKGILIGHLLHTKFEEIQSKRLHFKSKKAEDNNQKNVDLFLLTEKIINENNYPTHRKEKADNILRTFYQNQTFEGEKIKIKKGITFWGFLFLQSFEEMTFYLREFESEELIRIILDGNGDMDMLQFTGKGLDRIENSKLDKENLSEEDTAREFEIGLSFAGEQREYVEEVARHLKDLGLKIFYDDYETIDLWGKNLYQHLNDVYKNKCLYCIIFISKDYTKKLWTKHELQSAQARAFEENREYILPARFDDTILPGLDDTTGYIDLATVSPKELAEKASNKVRNHKKDLHGTK